MTNYWIMPGKYLRWIRDISYDRRFGYKQSKMIELLKKSDKIIIYASLDDENSSQPNGILGIVFAHSDYYYNPEPLDDYPKEFSFDNGSILKNPISFKPILNKMSFRDKYPGLLQHPVIITKNDYMIIKRYIYNSDIPFYKVGTLVMDVKKDLIQEWLKDNICKIEEEIIGIEDSYCRLVYENFALTDININFLFENYKNENISKLVFNENIIQKNLCETNYINFYKELIK